MQISDCIVLEHLRTMPAIQFALLAKTTQSWRFLALVPVRLHICRICLPLPDLSSSRRLKALISSIVILFSAINQSLGLAQCISRLPCHTQTSGDARGCSKNAEPSFAAVRQFKPQLPLVCRLRACESGN